MSSTLPEGVYFAIHYVDRQGRVENWHNYYEDGRVELVDEDGTLLVYQFTPTHVAELKSAILDLATSDAVQLALQKVHDAGVLSYQWSFDGNEGATSSPGQPPIANPTISRLDAVWNNWKPNRACLTLPTNE